MERQNGEVRDREKTKRGLKNADAPILKGYQIFHNYIREHEGLDGKTPAEAAGITIEGSNKWLTIIQNASHSLKKTPYNEAIHLSHRATVRPRSTRWRLATVLLLGFCAMLPLGSAASNPNTTITIPKDPSITVTPSRGPPNSVITVNGSGFDPGSHYVLCLSQPAPLTGECAAFLYVVDRNHPIFNTTQQYVTGANLSLGVKLWLPCATPSPQGCYSLDSRLKNASFGNTTIGVFPLEPNYGNTTIRYFCCPIATAPFSVTTAATKLSASSGQNETVISISGGGLLPSTSYVYCILRSSSGNSPLENSCPTGSSSFTTDTDGNLPSGLSIHIPSGTLSGYYGVAYEQAGVGAVMLWDPFAIQGTSVAIRTSPSVSSSTSIPALAPLQPILAAFSPIIVPVSSATGIDPALLFIAYTVTVLLLIVGAVKAARRKR